MDEHLSFYIDGQWVQPEGRRALDVINPATEESFARIALGTEADVHSAVSAAKRAFSRYSRTSRKERIDRELMELLNELRVALPGVQFLFAFLLIVPFSPQAPELSDFQRDVYLATLLAAAVATGLLIAPAAQHRVLSGSTTRRHCCGAATGRRSSG